MPEAIRRILTLNPMQLVLPLITFGATFAAAWLFSRLMFRALRAWTRRTNSRPGNILLEALRGPVLMWALILAAHAAIQSSDLPEKYSDMGAKALLVLWIFSLTIMGVRIAGDLVRNYGEQVPGALPVTTLTESLAQLAVVILGIVLMLGALNVRITPILTALGVGGLAVALALQDTLSNLFSGFYVAVARQIRLGDYIKLNTGEEGYVTDIGWRSTSLRALANNMIIVPNSKLAQAIVTNYHLPEKRLSVNLQVHVSYTCDPDHVERVLSDLARSGAGEIPGLLAEPAPSVSFDPGFSDWALSFTLSFHVAEFSNQFPVRNELRKRVLRRFREEQIHIPFPARDLYFKNTTIPLPPQ